ncbi:hypothetical protein J8J27_25150, partial [Mycobacterium tuberculosis]|nr:hypothetical protein [Mycobacterium tuberculosis]
LLAANGRGDILWATPQAEKLIAEAFPAADGGPVLPAPARAAVAARTGASIPLGEAGGRRLSLAPLGQSGPDEWLFRLLSDDAGGEEAILRRRYALTAREAEVLL